MILFALLSIMIFMLLFFACVNWLSSLYFHDMNLIFIVNWIFHLPEALRSSIIITKCGLIFSIYFWLIYFITFAFVLNVFIVKHTINFFLFIMVHKIISGAIDLFTVFNVDIVLLVISFLIPFRRVCLTFYQSHLYFYKINNNNYKIQILLTLFFC